MVWPHTLEYGETKALKVFDSKFPEAFSNEVEVSYLKGFHGILLDWWHIEHPVPWKGKKLEQAMKRITDKIRAKLGNEFLILGNVNWRVNKKTVDHINGVFLELYKSPYERSDKYKCSEIAKMEKLIQFHQLLINFL